MARGEVRYRLVLDSSAFKSGVKDAEAAWKKLSQTLESKIGAGPLKAIGEISGAIGAMGPVLATVGAAATAAAGGLALITKEAIESGSRMVDLAAKTNGTVEGIQLLGAAFSSVGGSMDEAAQAAARMQKSLGDEKVAEAIGKLGLSAAALQEADPATALFAVGQALEQVGSRAEVAAIASDIFGKAWADVLPGISAEARAAAEEMQRLGFVVGTEVAQALDEAGDRLGIARGGLTALTDNIGATIVQSEAFKTAVEGLINLLARLNTWWKANGESALKFAEVLGRISAGIATLGMSEGAIAALKLAAQAGPGAGGATGFGAPPTDLRAKAIEAHAKAQEKAAEAARRWATETASLNRQLDETSIAIGKAQMTLPLATSIKAPSTAGGGLFSDKLGFTGIGTMFGGTAAQVMPNLDEVTKKAAETVLRFQEGRAALGDWSVSLANIARQVEVLGSSLLSSVAGGIAAIGAQLKNISGAGGFGALLKGGFSGIMQGLSGALSIGAAALSIGKSIWNAFTSSPAEKAARDAGYYLGSKVSEEMGKAILQTSQQLGISIQNAALLHLPQVMQGQDPHKFFGQIYELLGKIASGAIPAAEGIKALDESFKALADSALKAGKVGDNAVVRILQAARASGTMTEGMRAFSREQVGRATGAAGGIVGLEIPTAEIAASQAAIFSSIFWATVREQGLPAAVEALSAPFAALKEKLAEGGFDVAALLGPIGTMFDYMGNTQIKGAVEAAGALNEALQGLANAGYITEQSFAAFGTSAVAAYEQATAAGMDQNSALASIAPLLANIVKVADQYGLTIDENTQALINQAEEAGIAFPQDPILQMTDAIRELINTLRELHGIPPYNPVSGNPRPGSGGSVGTGGGYTEPNTGPRPGGKGPSAEAAAEAPMAAMTKGGGDSGAAITMNIFSHSPTQLARDLVNIIRQNVEGARLVVHEA